MAEKKDESMQSVDMLAILKEENETLKNIIKDMNVQQQQNYEVLKSQAQAQKNSKTSAGENGQKIKELQQRLK